MVDFSKKLDRFRYTDDHDITLRADWDNNITIKRQDDAVISYGKGIYDPEANGRYTVTRETTNKKIIEDGLNLYVPEVITKMPDVEMLAVSTEEFTFRLSTFRASEMNADLVEVKGLLCKKIPLHEWTADSKEENLGVLLGYLGPEWVMVLKDEFKKTYMVKLSKRVIKDREKGVVCPDAKDVFTAYLRTPLSKVKVVIIGQDPYHTPGIANGMAFASKKMKYCPPSLVNILKEISIEYNSKVDTSHYGLYGWAGQGVFLLNTSLTVKDNEPGSHKGIGWSHFIIKTIEAICKHQDNVAWMLWGKHAESVGMDFIKNPKHLILKAPHPSPMNGNKFIGNGHFRKANKYLINSELEPINWLKL